MLNGTRSAVLQAAIATALIMGSTAALAEPAERFGEMFSKGKAQVQFRYRLESVDQDGFDEDALASTLRTRLNFTTASLHGFSAKAELDYVAAIGPDDYNAGAGNSPDKGEYPVVADPTGPDLNQAFVQWESGKGTQIRGGRSRIIYDNARFVGSVGWRQNEQTFDAATVEHKAAGFDFQAAWVGQVNRIFGKDVAAGQHDTDTWLFNASRTFDGAGKLVAYYYDIDDRDAAAFSTRSVGLRFNGERTFESFTLGYGAEWARQKDAHNNPVSYNADYYRFDLSLGLGLATPYLAWESLGGDAKHAGSAFRTPLATLHAFNGWADKFLTTPDAGLNDRMMGVRGKIADWKWNTVYHRFEAESGGADYGSELDASIGRSFAEHYSVLFKAAWFRADSDSSLTDTTKLWFMFSANF